MTSWWSCGSRSSGIWAKRQPSAVRVNVQTTSKRSSGHSCGGVGVTDGKASAMAGISLCCQEISVVPGCSRTSFDELLLLALAVLGVHRDAERVGERGDGLAGPLPLALVGHAGGVDRAGAGEARPRVALGRVEQVDQARAPAPSRRRSASCRPRCPSASRPGAVPSGFSPCRMIMTTSGVDCPAGVGGRRRSARPP